MKHPKINIAAQMYTVRDYAKTPEDIYRSLKKIKNAGYEAVQVSGLGPIDDRKLKDMTDEFGLYICATHVDFDSLSNDIEQVIKQHELWNCKYVGLGAMPLKYRSSKEGYQTFAKAVSQFAKELSAAGLQFIYHNHSFEFQKFEGECGMDILIDECSPEVDFELDTYWIQHGGADPVAWINKVAGRMDVVHFKDMIVQKDGYGAKQLMAEVGKGNLNWEAIIDACVQTNVKWAAVEQDECQRDPFESLAISRRNLLDMGL